jgi:hypothetical protein
MGEYLGLSQAAVSDMETRGHESGPVSRLLDQLEAEVRRGAEAGKASSHQ